MANLTLMDNAQSELVVRALVDYRKQLEIVVEETNKWYLLEEQEVDIRQRIEMIHAIVQGYMDGTNPRFAIVEQG